MHNLSQNVSEGQESSLIHTSCFVGLLSIARDSLKGKVLDNKNSVMRSSFSHFSWFISFIPHDHTLRQIWLVFRLLQIRGPKHREAEEPTQDNLFVHRNAKLDLGLNPTDTLGMWNIILRENTWLLRNWTGLETLNYRTFWDQSPWSVVVAAVVPGVWLAEVTWCPQLWPLEGSHQY